MEADLGAGTDLVAGLEAGLVSVLEAGLELGLGGGNQVSDRSPALARGTKVRTTVTRF